MPNTRFGYQHGETLSHKKNIIEEQKLRADGIRKDDTIIWIYNGNSQRYAEMCLTCRAIGARLLIYYPETHRFSDERKVKGSYWPTKILPEKIPKGNRCLPIDLLAQYYYGAKPKAIIST